MLLLLQPDLFCLDIFNIMIKCACIRTKSCKSIIPTDHPYATYKANTFELQMQSFTKAFEK